jgi:hypothetical protein
MISNLKIEDFQQKACMFAGGHMTGAPTIMTYAIVVSRETIRIALTIAALNDLKVKAADIPNAYISAPIKKKVWCTLGPDFGPATGRSAIIVHALYELKSARAAFHAHLADCMQLGNPSMYLGAKLKLTQMNNGVWAWGMSPAKYINEAVSNCKMHLILNYNGWNVVPTQTANPFVMGYKPELDKTLDFDPERASYYQSIISVMQWMCKIGHIKIATEVLLL